MSRNEIVTETDLVTAVEDALKRRGVYEKLKAKIRAEVFHVLDDKDVPVARTDRDLPPDLFLARELVKEFLMTMRLENTLSVFNEEMGQGMEMSVDRAFIGSELGLSTAGCDERLPLLVLIAQFLKKNREDFLQNIQIPMPSTRGERDTRIDLAKEHTDNENNDRRQTVKSGNSSISSRSNSSLSPASSRSGRQHQQTEDEKLTVLVEERGESDSQQDEDDDDSEAPLSLPTLPVYSRNTEANRDASMAEPDYSYSFYAESEA